jgi:hypothetical protein
MDAVDKNKLQYPPVINLTGAGLGLDAIGKRIFLLRIVFVYLSIVCIGANLF